MSVSDDVRKKVQRWMDAGNAFSERMIALADTLPEASVREIVKLMFDEVRYLGEHMPREREQIAPFACSGETYHYCSFSARHDPGCKAVGGSGELTNSYASARSCAPDCGETDAQPWCHCSGFDCGTCELVDRLLGMLAELEHGAAA